MEKLVRGLDTKASHQPARQALVDPEPFDESGGTDRLAGEIAGQGEEGLPEACRHPVVTIQGRRGIGFALESSSHARPIVADVSNGSPKLLHGFS
jgi:hypothetical protein